MRVVISARGTGGHIYPALAIISKIKEKDGTIHDVIMLGSNSYLNLSTHPQVMQGAREALEKFGYGMGAVSNYAGITEIHKELEARIKTVLRRTNNREIVTPQGKVAKNVITTGVLKIDTARRQVFRKILEFIFNSNYEQNMKFLDGINMPLDSTFKSIMANNLMQENYLKFDF